MAKSTLNLGAIDLTVVSSSVSDERSTRNTIANEHTGAKKLMDVMSDDRREALVSLVSEAMAELAGSVERWLDGALVAKSDEKIGVYVLFKLGNLDEQIVRLRAINEAERNSRIADLARIAGGTDPAPG